MSLLLSLLCLPLARCDGPVELGRVSWRRDHAAAFAEAKRLERPVLLLFQEIPG